MTYRNAPERQPRRKNTTPRTRRIRRAVRRQLRPESRRQLQMEPLEARQLLAAVVPNVLANNPALDPSPPGSGFTQSETSTIAFGNTVVVAYNDSGSAVGGAAKFTGYARSTDGGATFTDLGSLPTDARGDGGDPVLARDNASGNIYLATLVNNFNTTTGLQLFTSTDGGASFGAPVNPAPGSALVQDKPWLAIDNTGGANQGNLYLVVRDFGSGSQGIRFYSSTDNGATWGPNGGTLIASEGANNVQGAFVTVAPNGSVDVYWYDQSAGVGTNPIIRHRRSTDAGATFGAVHDIATLNETTSPNGNLGLGFRSNVFPHAATNPVTGDLYVVYADDPTGVDQSNVYFQQSTDGGVNWSSRVRINNDTTTNDQFFPTVIASETGDSIFFGFYDRRLDPANTMINAFGAVAKVNTATSAVTMGSNFRISDTAFAPLFGIDGFVNSTYMGDYDTAVAVAGDYVYSWADNRLGTPDVRTTNFPQSAFTDSIIIADDPGGNGAGNGTSDTFRLQLSTDGLNVDVYLNGNFSQSIPLASITTLTVQGSSDDDHLIVDFTNGNPVPGGGLTYNGGESAGDNDTIEVTGFVGGTTVVTHTATESGTVTVSGSAAIAFNQTEPLTLSGTAADLVINLPAGPNSDVVLANDLGNVAGVSEIRGSTFENTTFNNPTNSLTVQLGSNGDTIQQLTMDAGFSPAAGLTINGGNNVDNVSVTPSANFAIQLDGNNPTGLPGDVLNVNLTGTAGGRLQLVPEAGGATGGWSFTSGQQAISFQEFESVNVTGGLYNLAVREDLSASWANNGGADRIEVSLDSTGNNLLLTVNGVPQASLAMGNQVTQGINTLEVIGSNDSEILAISETAGGLPSFPGNLVGIDISGTAHQNGPFLGSGRTNGFGSQGMDIVFDANGGANDGVAFILLNSHDVAYYSDAMTSANSGNVNIRGQLNFSFSDLTPLVLVGAGGSLTLDASGTPGTTFLNVADDPGNLAGPGGNVVTGNGGFETSYFSGFNTVSVIGGTGSETISLISMDPASTETVINLDGDNSANTDVSDDILRLGSLPAGITANFFGGAGNDNFENITGPAPFTRNLDGVLGTVNVDGQTGTDRLAYSDSNSAVPDVATLTATQLLGATGPGGTGGPINYVNLDSFYYEATSSRDVINVIETLAGVEYIVNGDGGDDQITIGNQTSDFNAATYDGTLTPIQGHVTVFSDFNNSAGVDTLNVDASQDGALAASPASISNIGAQVNVPFLNNFPDTFTFQATRLAGFAPANIDYAHLDIGTTVSGSFGNRLENLNVRSSQGADTINVNDTTATRQTVLETRQGDDDVTIRGDFLSASNIFRGEQDNDDFTLNIATHIGNNAVFPVSGVRIEGNGNTAPGPNTDNRDRVTINDNNNGFQRDLIYDYQDGLGDVDIEAASTNNGLFGPNGGGNLDLLVRTTETVIFNTADDNDLVEVEGTSFDDDLTVALLESANDALVFLNGNPYTEAPGVATPGDSVIENLPGVAGGSAGPDLLIRGVQAPNGILLDGSGISSIGNRAIVQAASEDPVLAGSTDVFGFGAGVLIPGFDAGDAFDNININNGASGPNRVTVFNTDFAGLLLPVEVDPGSFVNISPVPNRPGLIVNAGDEAGLRPGQPIADDIYAMAHPQFNIQVNGNLPTLALGPDGLPVGDQLNLQSPTSFNIWSDKSTPPNVSIFAGNDPFGVFNSSIERTLLLPGNGVVNLIGDQNNVNVDQTDNFVVVGRNVDGNLADGGYQEATISINGSAPIMVEGMEFLNAYGFDLQGVDKINPDIQPQLMGGGPKVDTPVSGDADNIDTLDIRPYADDQPTGWGVDVSYNEGVPSGTDGAQLDLLIVRTSLYGGNVSENIVIQPSDPEAGEVVITNAGFGTPIVDIDFVANLDVIVLDDDGFANDTDTLTLRGTDPANPGTSGNETFDINFGAAGDVANPMVTVTDTTGAVPMYRLRTIDNAGGNPTFSTVNFQSLGGTDLFNVTPDANVAVFIDAAAPIGSIQSQGDTLNVITGGAATAVTLNQDLNSGTVTVMGAQPVNFVNIEVLQLDGVNYVLPTQRPTIDLPDANDTGISDLDNVTNTPNPVPFMVTAEVGTTVIIKDGNAVIDGPYVSTGTDVRLLNLGNGTHKLSAEASDAGSNELYQSEELIVTIDRTPPIAGTPDMLESSDSGSSATDNITNKMQPAFSGRGEANATVRIVAVNAVTGVANLVGVGTIGSDESDVNFGFSPTDGQGIWEVTVEPLVDGFYNIFVEVEDLAGNVTTPQSLPIQVDATPPMRPTIDLVNTDDTGWSEFDNITIGDPNAGPGLGLTYRITGEPGTSVLVKDGDTVIGALVIPPGGVTTFTANFTEGPHPLTTVTTDTAGNMSQSEQLLVEVDFTAPTGGTIGLANYSDSGTLGDGITSKMQPAFVGLAEPNSHVRLFAAVQGGPVEQIGEAFTGSDESDLIDTNNLGRWEITSEPLVDGNYIVWADIEDQAGNIESLFAQAVLITIDSLGPQRPTIDLVNLGDTGWSEFDNVTQGDLTSVGFGQGIVQYRITGDPGETFVVKDGNIDITAMAGVTLPEGNVIPADGDTFITVDYNTLAANGLPIGTGYPVNGPHPMSVELIDLAGNVSAQSEELLVEIDTIAPTGGTIALAPYSDSGIVGDNITNKMQPAFTGVAEPNSHVRLFAITPGGQLVQLGEAFTGSDESDLDPANNLGLWEITAEPLVDGNWLITADIEDQAGNLEFLGNVAITIDGTTPQRPTVDLVGMDTRDQQPNVANLPAIVLVNPIPSDSGRSTIDNVTYGVDPTNPGGQGTTDVQLRISAEPGSTVLVKDGEQVITNFVMPASPFVFLYLDNILDEDPHPISVEAFDTAGNRSAQSEELLVIVDVTPPATPAAPDLLESSDSFDNVAGLSGPIWNSTDNVTNVSQPAFQGVAEKNAVIRVWATNTATGTSQVIGEGVVGSDDTDGIVGNNLGRWEVTVEPLADGVYDIRVDVEDLAGNISPQSAPLRITVDTLAPQRPTIDLQDADDTGSSDMDNVTIGDPTALPNTRIATFRVSAETNSRVLVKDGEQVIADFQFTAAFDNNDGVLDGFGNLTIDFDANQTNFNIPAEGAHPLSAEAFDRAGNRSAQSEQLLVTIDTTPPADAGISIALKPTSDDGIPGDNATTIQSVGFYGLAEANAHYRLYANGVQVAEGTVGSDESDGNPNNGLGVWDPGVTPLAYDDYFVTIVVEDLAGNITYASDYEYVIVDPYEINDTIPEATVLGSLKKITKNDVILHNREDRDVWKYTAQDTGKLIINVHFPHQAGDIDIIVTDMAGNNIAFGTSVSDNEQIIIPVVSQEMYFIHVYNGSPGLFTVSRDPGGLATPQLRRIATGTDPATDLTAPLAISLAGQTVLEANGLAKHPATGQLFALLTLQGQVGRQLVTLDSNTGVATSVGNTGDLFKDLAFNATGTLYGVTDVDALFLQPEGLFTLNQTTGAPTLVTALDTNSIGEAIGFNPLDGNLYRMSGVTDFNVFDTRIYSQINLATLVETPITLTFPTAGAAPVGDEYDQIESLTFDPITASFVAGGLDGYMFSVTAPPVNPIGGIVPAGTVTLLTNLDDIATGAAYAFDRGIYDLEIENFEAPVPSTVVLDPNDDSGMMNNDLITYYDDSRFYIIADLADFAAMGIDILTPTEIANNEPGAAVEVFANGASVGYATQVGGSNTLFSFNFDPTGAVNGSWSQIIPINGGTAVAPANQGYFNIVNAAVRIFDGQAAQATGRSTMSASTNPHFDPNAPDILLATIDMLNASDSGHTVGDDITKINRPAFAGVAEENTKIRLFANGELVGQSVVNSDNSNGINDDGLGTWEITVEPLVDGDYDITIELEDVAGNVSARSAVLLTITVDTLDPQRPTIDLVGVDVVDNDKLGVAPIPSDTGLNTMDNNTRGFARDTNAGTAQVQVRVSAEPGGIVVIKDGENPIDSFEMPSTITTTFNLNGAEEVPANGSSATGTATITLDTHTGDFTWNVSYTPLVGTFTAAHFHGPAPKGLIAPVEVPITATVNPVTRTAVGAAVLSTEQISDLLAGQWYLNIHSTTFPGGEIRGQVLYSPANDFVFRTLTLDEDPHPLSVEVFDWAGNRSAQSQELLVTVDITDPAAPTTPDMLASSDSGMVDTDNVTHINAPAFRGLGEANSLVRIFARQLDGNGNPINPADFLLIGQGVVGSDESDDPQDTGPDNEIGIWEVTVEPLADGRYEITAELEDKYGNISVLSSGLSIEIDTEAPNTPYLDLIAASDTGRNDEDNVTNDNTLTFTMTTQDRTANPMEYSHLFATNFKFRLYVRPEAASIGVTGQELLIYDSAVDATIPPAAISNGLTSLDFLQRVMATLPDGYHNFKLEVEDRAGNISEDYLLDVVIDTQAFLGDGNLHPDSDSGVWGFPATMSDRITDDKVPSFFGVAEANNIVTVAIDGVPAGTTVAVPLDGNDAFQPPNAPYQGVEANWTIDTVLNLADGLHSAVFTFEDQAGNRVTSPALQFFVDTVGPRIENVTFGLISVDGVDSFDGTTSLFEPKPTGGPDPLVHSIVVHYSDLPNRVNPFLYGPVFQALALEEGNYSVVGDANGNIPIVAVNLLAQNTGPGKATATYELVFGVPLPDDRFTVTVSDSIKDQAGNALDGESGAAAPFDGNDAPNPTPPIFPTGDGEHGGEFVARFTIDSRAELAVWGAGSVWADINGNFIFDPENTDYVNRDIVFTMGITSDDVFAGNFSGPGPDGIFGTQDDHNPAFIAGDAIADGYDKLAAWGDIGVAGQATFDFRWLVDLDNDGRPDLFVDDPNLVDGYPVAGSFDGTTINGDEVGLFTGGGLTGGGTWYFDTNHDYILDTSVKIAGMIGLPIVGDFNNDGVDDLGVWSNDVFKISLGNTPGGVGPNSFSTNLISFRFGFIGQRERPISADFDADGYDDIGLWVPDRAGAVPEESAEWYILVSGGQSVLNRIEIDPSTGQPVIEFVPVPFGSDIYAKFGDDFAKPVVGNFDPPSNPTGTEEQYIHQNPANRYDINNDGLVSPADVLMGVNSLNAKGSRPLDYVNTLAPFFDVSGDKMFSPADPLAVINYLNARGQGEGEAAGISQIVMASAQDNGSTVLATNYATPTPSQPAASTETQVESVVDSELELGLLVDRGVPVVEDWMSRATATFNAMRRSAAVSDLSADLLPATARTAASASSLGGSAAPLSDVAEYVEESLQLDAILNDLVADVTSQRRSTELQDELFGGMDA